MSFIKKERGDFEVPRHKGSYSRKRLVSVKLYNKSHPRIPFCKPVTPHLSVLNAVLQVPAQMFLQKKGSNTEGDWTKQLEVTAAPCNLHSSDFYS